MAEDVKARRARGQRMYESEPEAWTDDDLVAELTLRYAPSEIPPCRVCGGKLSIRCVGGGEPTEWACSPVEDDPERPDHLRLKLGRLGVDVHYRDSRYVDRRQGGDGAVMELLRRYVAARHEGDVT
jgi:hypothetical protein